MSNESTLEKRGAAEICWLVAAMAFGMCFLYPPATLWWVYKTQYSQSQMIWWAFLSLILFLFERLAYRRWRQLAAQVLVEEAAQRELLLSTYRLHGESS